MQMHWLAPKETLGALGALTALLLSTVMIRAFKFGIAPIPKLPSLAFAEIFLGPNGLPPGRVFCMSHT